MIKKKKGIKMKTKLKTLIKKVDRAIYSIGVKIF